MANIDSVKLPNGNEYNLQDVVSAKGSQPNLLINGWFTVNQRGAASYSDGKYCADRWSFAALSSTSTVTINANGATFVFAAGETGCQLKQKFESIPWAGKTVTVSAIVDGVLYSATATWPNDSSSLQVNLNNSGLSAFLNNTSGNLSLVIRSTSAVTIRAVKLELGSSSTLANDAPPDYTTELLKCQRYFVRIQARGISKSVFVTYGTSTTSTIGTLYLAVPLRAQPTIAYSGFELRDIATETNIAITSMSVGSDTFLNIPTIITSSSSGITKERAYIFRSTTATSYLDFDAEL